MLDIQNLLEKIKLIAEGFILSYNNQGRVSHLYSQAFQHGERVQAQSKRILRFCVLLNEPDVISKARIILLLAYAVMSNPKGGRLTDLLYDELKVTSDFKDIAEDYKNFVGSINAPYADLAVKQAFLNAQENVKKRIGESLRDGHGLLEKEIEDLAVAIHRSLNDVTLLPENLTLEVFEVDAKSVVRFFGGMCDSPEPSTALFDLEEFSLTARPASPFDMNRSPSPD